jgi:hypothetical protein
MIDIEKLLPYLCKYDSCLQKADYEFTDVKEDTTSVDGHKRETIVIGHACNNHVTEVHKLLKEIYYGNKKSDNNK